MARYKAAKCRLCRRENTKLYLKGDRCFTDKCAVERRPYPPGQHGQGRSKISDYGTQLREKQKIRRVYGVLERQFSNYYLKAARKKGMTGATLISFLEKRLDSVVYSSGFASSRDQARLFVKHGHFFVNDRRVTIPSFIVKVGDVVTLKDKMKTNPHVSTNILNTNKAMPLWLELSSDKLTSKIISEPTKENSLVNLQEQLVVELYSK